MKIYSNNPAIAVYLFSFLLMATSVNGNPKCYKRLPEIKSSDSCCSLKEFYTVDIREKCSSSDDHFKLDTEQTHLCFISCAFEQIGIFNGDKFQEEVLESYLNVALQSSMYIKNIIKTNFKECVQDYAKLGDIIPKQGSCALYPVLIMDCTFIKTFKECPDANWSNTDNCNEIREHWRECLQQEM